MAGKVRVFELARELGIDSKSLISELKDMGEYVKSAQSTLEAPTVRKVKDRRAGGKAAGSTQPAGRVVTPPPAAAARPAAPKAPAPAAPAAQASAPVADTTAPAAAPAPAPAARPKPLPGPRAATPKAPAPGVPGAAKPAPVAKPSAVKPARKPAAAAPAPAETPAAVAPEAPAVVTPAEAPAAPAAVEAPAAPTAGGVRPMPGPARRPGAPVPGRPGAVGRSQTSTTPLRRAPRDPAGAPRPEAGTDGARPQGAPRPGDAPRPRSADAGRPARSADANRPPRPGAEAPRPARPGAPKPGAAGPRPGNNPFAAAGSGMGRPARPTPGDMPPRPRPNPSMMPPRPQGAPRPGMPGRGPRPGGPGVGPRPGGAPRPGGFGPRPGGFSGGPGGPGAGAGAGARPGGGGRGRGGAAGAFGRGRPSKGRKSKKQRRQEFDNMQAPTFGGIRVPRGNGAVVRLPRGASLTDFAERIDVDPAALVTVLFTMGEMVTATQSVDDETFGLLGAELGYQVEVVSAEDEDRQLLSQFDIDFEFEDEENLVARPPVVTVMGHVDHGKTKLLDAIRNANVVAGEAGGITQHIGAYQVSVDHEGVNRQITFIDTPGHEAFTAMRARGTQVTDIAVLVVAADDGVMPQTTEALNHAQAAGVPIVVAVNKVDKEGANPAKIRQQLTEYNLVAEEYGGDTMFVDVSAKEHTGIGDLLEAVLLTADASLDLRANAAMEARGVAIEGHLDKGRGPVATVLVQRGTLRPGDAIVTGRAFGRVRAMLDANGAKLTEAGPSCPVQVLGLSRVPNAGDKFLVASDDRTARQIAEKREAMERAAANARARKRVTLEGWLEESKVETLNLILKGDVSGSVEALEDALLKIDVGEEVSLRIIDRGVGAITQTNIMLAAASDAVIVGFNVRPEDKNRQLADREGVEIRYYSVIYNAIEEIESALKGMLKPEFEEIVLGTAEIREVFRSSKFGNIAGCLVQTGTVRRNSKARLLRGGVVINDALHIDSLRRFKDDATEVREGYECGIGLGSWNDIEIGDVIETYEMQEKPR